MKLSSIFIFIIISTLSVQGYHLIDSTTSKKDSLYNLEKPHWKKNFSTGVNLNQASFSQNWKAGGSNSFAAAWFLKQHSELENLGWRFASDVDVQLGFIRNKSNPFRKSVDRIYYEFKAGYRLSQKWDFYGSTNFQSQFLSGFKYDFKRKDGSVIDSLISSTFSPAYLTTSMGFEVHPNKEYYTRFGIGTLRQTFVLDRRISDAGLYGLAKPGDRVRNQFVLQFLINMNKDIMENVNLQARYTGQYDYFKIEDPNSYVHRIDATVTMKVNKYLNANLQTILFRDRDQDIKWQFSQAISLGLVYRLDNY
ncbi:MAG: hypothetical protein RIR51_712 [Bacteroidota bacterium]|jgi:hypothetical protein